jgi:hypothetical protein
MIGAYIFYVFNTLTQRHITMALESIRDQSFDVDVFDFIVYNNSTEFNSLDILREAYDLTGSNFRSMQIFSKPYPNTSRTLDDVNHQIKMISGYDFYFCHKSDFIVSKNVIQNVVEYSRSANNPYFLGFTKFDLREYVSNETIKQLSKMSFDQIMETGLATDLTGDVPDFLNLSHSYIGYRGWDGTIHAYNEKARQSLDLDTYIQPHTIARNIENGVNWSYGLKEFLALHIFHELPNGRNADKDIVGHRF